MRTYEEMIAKFEAVNAEMKVAVYEMTREIKSLNKKLNPTKKRSPGPRSAETRAKISASKTGGKHTEETKKLMGLLKLGKPRKPFSDEWRANLSASRKAYFEQKKLEQK